MEKGTDRKIITTDDGSHSIELLGKGEHYHSIYGAVQESRHVFIRHGLFSLPVKESSLSILEVGFGTGLNALLTLIESQKLGIHVNYFTLEPFPLVKEEFELLNYALVLKEEPFAMSFLAMHQCTWEKETEISKDFIFHKSITGLMEATLAREAFDLVYFDAFGPDTQPELWTQEVFEKVWSVMRPGGTLVTYCAKGAVRRALKGCGFSIEKISGPPGKREMTRAIKSMN